MKKHTDLFPRELDAALAERLFGWRRVAQVTKDGEVLFGHSYHLLPNQEMGYGWAETPDLPWKEASLYFSKETMWPLADVPHYSTTGDAMLLLLDAMRERLWEWELTTRPVDDPRQGEFVARCYRWCGDKWEEPKRAAETLPRAVALAALQALETEVSA